jgi:hypothetical protein
VAAAIISNAINTPARDMVLIFSLLVMRGRGAVRFLVFGWRNGKWQDTTSTVFPALLEQRAG